MCVCVFFSSLLWKIFPLTRGLLTRFLNELFLPRRVVSFGLLTLQAVTLTLLLTARLSPGAAQMSAEGRSARSGKIFLPSHHIKPQTGGCHLRGTVCIYYIHPIVEFTYLLIVINFLFTFCFPPDAENFVRVESLHVVFGCTHEICMTVSSVWWLYRYILVV